MCERKCYFIKDTRIISNSKNTEMIVSTNCSKNCEQT